MNKLDKKLLDILVCPVSKGSLEQIGDELICRESNLAYPIKDGIPVMLPEGKFAGKTEINKKNPLGDLRWLIGK